MDKLIDYICEELEGLEKKAAKGNLSAAEIQYGDTLAHFKKNLLTAEAMEESDGYSGDMRNGDYSRGYYPMHNRGASYAGRRNAKRDSMGRYSRAEQMEGFADSLRDIMADAPNESVRQEIQRLVNKVENM